MQEAIKFVGFRLCFEKKSHALFKCDVFDLGGRLRFFRAVRMMVYVFCIKALGKKLVYTIHDKIPLHIKSGRSWIIDYIGLFMLKHANKIVIHSTESIDFVKSLLPSIDTQKFMYVPHPNYITVCQDRKTYVCEARKNHKILITFAGAIREYKCLEVLIAAANELQEYSDMHFLICGRGRKEYIAKLQAMIEGCNNITADFRFIDDDEMPSLLNMSDAVVLPYDSTLELNSGASYLAFSFGRTVIGTHTGTTNDIEDQSLIYCYDFSENEAEHTAALKEAIMKFYQDFKNDPESVRLKGETLRDMMIQKHSIEQTAAALKEVYTAK